MYQSIFQLYGDKGMYIYMKYKTRVWCCYVDVRNVNVRNVRREYVPSSKLNWNFHYVVGIKIVYCIRINERKCSV